ncbi:acyltransferase family protein [Larkinella sp. GY13]|uniref:acyltransferase family protein n=1 Tax=Larkinella sp. GY13 TaxID=3453720 RepID=UPI003EEFD8D7
MNKRFHVLDGFRGIFALVVALYHFKPGPGIIGHTALISHGWLFVDFFFTLSGFVIYYNYQKIQTISQQKDFLIKRFIRLYPLHFCLLIVFLLFETFKIFLYKYDLFNYPPFYNHRFVGFVANIFLVQTYGLPIKGLEYLSWNTSSWSISAEIFAYIIFCFSIVYINRFSSFIKILIFLAFSVISLVIIYYVNGGNLSLKIGIPGIWRCTYSFFLGCIASEVYSILNKKYTSLSSQNQSMFYLFTFLEFLTLSVSLWSVAYWSDISFVSPLFFLLTIVTFSFELGWISKKMDTPFFKELGVLSYSIYMNNALIKTFFDIIILRFWKVDSAWYDLTIIPYVAILYYISRYTYQYFEVYPRKLLESYYYKKPLTTQVK